MLRSIHGLEGWLYACTRMSVHLSNRVIGYPAANPTEGHFVSHRQQLASNLDAVVQFIFNEYRTHSIFRHEQYMQGQLHVSSFFSAHDTCKNSSNFSTAVVQQLRSSGPPDHLESPDSRSGSSQLPARLRTGNSVDAGWHFDGFPGAAISALARKDASLTNSGSRPMAGLQKVAAAVAGKICEWMQQISQRILMQSLLLSAQVAAAKATDFSIILHAFSLAIYSLLSYLEIFW